MSDMAVINEAEEKGRTDTWPLWRKAYAQGDPLPKLVCKESRPAYRFDEGDTLPEEYKTLLIKMLKAEGERAGNKSFLGRDDGCRASGSGVLPKSCCQDGQA